MCGRQCWRGRLDDVNSLFKDSPLYENSFTKVLNMNIRTISFVRKFELFAQQSENGKHWKSTFSKCWYFHNSEGYGVSQYVLTYFKCCTWFRICLHNFKEFNTTSHMSTQFRICSHDFTYVHTMLYMFKQFHSFSHKCVYFHTIDHMFIRSYRFPNHSESVHTIL